MYARNSQRTRPCRCMMLRRLDPPIVIEGSERCEQGRRDGAVTGIIASSRSQQPKRAIRKFQGQMLVKLAELTDV
jgi:hypothetical protein